MATVTIQIHHTSHFPTSFSIPSPTLWSRFPPVSPSPHLLASPGMGQPPAPATSSCTSPLYLSSLLYPSSLLCRPRTVRVREVAGLKSRAGRGGRRLVGRPPLSFLWAPCNFGRAAPLSRPAPRPETAEGRAVGCRVVPCGAAVRCGVVR